MLTFTDAAIKQLATALEEGEMVRVAVQGGGCSGMSYVLNNPAANNTCGCGSSFS